MSELIGTSELMRVLDIKSFSTINKLERNGIITPVKIGRVKKWNLRKCIDSVIKNGTNAKN